MLKLSALLSLLRLHLQAYEIGNVPVPPESAATIARLLSSGEAHAKDMEAIVYPSGDEALDIAQLLESNVVSLDAFMNARAAGTSSPAGEPA